MFRILIAFLLLGGCGAAHGEPRMGPMGPMMGGSMGQPVEHHEQMFVDHMIPHHEGAVAMAKIALERAEHPEIRALAQSIIDSQTAEIDQLNTWRQQWFGETGTMRPMEGMMSMSDAQLEALRNAQPFDKAFIDAMIPHHEQAIRMAQMVIDHGARAELREMAEGIIQAQQHEIDEMTAWRNEWYPEGGTR